MASEAWVVDTYNLSQYAHDIMTHDGLDDTPEIIVQDGTASQRNGVIPGIPYFGPGRKAVAMIVNTADPITGVEPLDYDSKRANYDKNLDTLTRIFFRKRLLDVRRTLSDGSVRQAWCRTVSPFAPAIVGTASGLIVIDLFLPYSFWADVADINSAQYSPASNINLAEFATATAPMADLKWKITGPATNPKVVDLETGAYFQYNGTIAAGVVGTLDSGNMQSVTNLTLANIVHDGDARWLTLHPSIDGARVDFTATGTTAATKLQVVGKRKFLR